MLKTVKSRAEAQFAATQKKDKQALKEKEKVRQERAEHVARLRALRLAKEAADKKVAAEKAAAEKAAAKKAAARKPAAKNKKPSPSPQAQRR
jgi:colicin import membrane protein